MAAALTPIKVSEETDHLLSHAAHFLSSTKKDVVDHAVREFVDRHREEINRGIRDALNQLDSSNKSAVSLLTGYSSAELDELGGVLED
jgi:hypothetical protein